MLCYVLLIYPRFSWSTIKLLQLDLFLQTSWKWWYSLQKCNKLIRITKLRWRYHRSTLEHVTPLGRPWSVYKNDVERRHLWLKWTWPGQELPSSIPAESILWRIFVLQIWRFQFKCGTSFGADNVEFTDGRTDGETQTTTMSLRPEKNIYTIRKYTVTYCCMHRGRVTYMCVSKVYHHRIR